MKKISVLAILLLSATSVLWAQWKPVGGRIMTQWGENLNPENVLPEYPRPQMERKDWMNLNGLWNYAILDKGSKEPKQFDGQILVPFAIESALSGVGKKVGSDKELWYEREFELPKSWDDRRVLLHFGAVDWQADVWVNDSLACSHKGGYTAFTADISHLLRDKGRQKIVVRVWDPTDESFQPRGKQVKNPNGIWYTSVTGIWQTVWLEPVSPDFIANVAVTPNIDENTLIVEAPRAYPETIADLEVSVYDGKKKVAFGKSKNGQYVTIKMPKNQHLWTPDDPFLYRLKLEVKVGDIVKDRVFSYAAMRKISVGEDEKGTKRFFLNNKELFLFGPLDQGWWPDGLYTAPTDEALMFDIKKTKEWGFNMIRKHVKVEPARWYTHCDRLGILVWQDMPSGDASPVWQDRKYFDAQELQRSKESEQNYLREWHEIISQHYSNPSVIVWVPFNEAWGQFKTKEIANITKQWDNTRLVNSASGGNHFLECGDILDIHNYPNPKLPFSDPDRITVLGEYGGIGLAVENHLWEPDRNWGYVQFKSSNEVTAEYEKYAAQLKELIPKGYAAAVYTQTTDVEIEVNGLMTYDRKVMKLNEPKLQEINKKIW